MKRRLRCLIREIDAQGSGCGINRSPTTETLIDVAPIQTDRGGGGDFTTDLLDKFIEYDQGRGQKIGTEKCAFTFM